MTTETTNTNVPEIDPAELLFNQRVEAFGKTFGEKYLDRFTDPIHFLNVEFFNYKMHKFYEGNFAFISRNVFSEYVYRRRPKYNRDLLIRYHELMAKKLDGVQKLLTKYTAQIDAVIANNGGNIDEIGYVKKRIELVPVIHAQARQYLDLLQLADALFTKVAAATLQGLIDSNSKTEIEAKTILSFRAVGNTVRSETVGLRKEAQRVRELMRSEDGVGEDHEMDTAINMQASVVEEGTVIERENALLSGVAFTESPEVAEYMNNVSAADKAPA